MADATEVLLTGSSAGGLAAFLHADHVHQYLRAELPALAKFKVLPDSGYFVDHLSTRGEPVIEEQFKSKGKDIQSAALSLEKVKNSEKKTQHKGGTTETWEKTLLDLKRETSSVSAALKSGQSYNKSYARLILGLVGEYVQGGVKFSEQDKSLIKRLGSL